MNLYTRIIAVFLSAVIIFSSAVAPHAHAGLVDDAAKMYSQSTFLAYAVEAGLAAAGTAVFGPVGGIVGTALGKGIYDVASWYSQGGSDAELKYSETIYVSDVLDRYGTTTFSSSYDSVVYNDYSNDGYSHQWSQFLFSDGVFSILYTSSSSSGTINLYGRFSVPASGSYSFLVPEQPVCLCGVNHYLDAYIEYKALNGSWTSLGKPNGSVITCSADWEMRFCFYWRIPKNPDNNASYHEFGFKPGFVLNADGSELLAMPDSYSRPATITGNYGIIGDNGQLTRIEQQTIINEGDQTYYNPVTNTTHDMSGWTYDYSTRTYIVTAEDGSESIITYGDDNIIIQEGDQTYNVYYLVESTGTDSGGSGDDSGQDPGDDPGTEDHTHSYIDQITKEPGCTLPGVRTYTCSCGDSYTKSVPATGHDWAISSQVNASYDPDTGELLQAGYVIYSCSTCGQQHKDDSGTGPPSSSSGSSGEDSLFGKLGELLGTAGSGVLDLISTAIGKLLDGVIALLEMAFEKLGRVVEILLSLFDAIPQLFGGYLDMFGAVFAFIPEDIMTLMTFGVACLVILGIWKMVRR